METNVDLSVFKNIIMIYRLNSQNVAHSKPAVFIWARFIYSNN